MAEITTVTIPQGDFVTSTLNGAMTAASTSITIGAGLNLDANGGFLEVDYDSTLAVGVDGGPETFFYTSYVTGTGAVTGITRAQAGTTAVAHSNGATIQQGMSSKYLLNGNVLGYAEVTSDFTHANNNVVTDVTAVTTTVTVPAGGRRIKITAFVSRLTTSAGAGTNQELHIREGSTDLNYSISTSRTSNDSYPMTAIAILTPTAGSHTYKVSILQSGAGTQTYSAGTGRAGFILVELI